MCSIRDYQNNKAVVCVSNANDITNRKGYKMEVVQLGDYENIKNGKRYSVLDYATNATNSQDGESMVIYTLTETAHYPTRTIYVRNYDEFLHKFKEL